MFWRPLEVRFDRRAPLIGAAMRLHNYCIDRNIGIELRQVAGCGIAPTDISNPKEDLYTLNARTYLSVLRACAWLALLKNYVIHVAFSELYGVKHFDLSSSTSSIRRESFFNLNYKRACLQTQVPS